MHATDEEAGVQLASVLKLRALFFTTTHNCMCGCAAHQDNAMRDIESGRQ